MSLTRRHLLQLLWPHATRSRIRPVVVATALCLAGSHATAPAQTVDPNLWVTNGSVSCVVQDGGTIYIGGGFTHVGPATGGGVPLYAATGGPSPSFPKVIGTVNAVAPDGVGGWYIGGHFTSVGGIPRSNLAHIATDLSVTGWNPNANEQVLALAVSGSAVYAGGFFTSIGGQARNYIAALDAATGVARAWNPNANSQVLALAVNGSAVYAGGYFTGIGAQGRNYIAALDATTGAATAWNPNANYSVKALAVSGSTVYVGGVFTNIGSQTRYRIAAVDASTGAATAWNPNADNQVLALAVNGSTVYAGGYFTSIGGQARNFIAAVNATTGAATAWNPIIVGTYGRGGTDPPYVGALAVTGATIYAGGKFTGIAGQARNNIGAMDATTGAATAWDPSASRPVNALAVNGSMVYVGGVFTSIGGKARNSIAALDAATGAATAWNPNVGGSYPSYPYVNALAVRGGVIYAGGGFTSIGGQARNYIAALDATTGAATAWNPNSDGIVYALEVSESTVYAGGSFRSIGGQVRSRIAALDVATGAATAWNPNALRSNSPFVFALAVSGSTVYAGGQFSSIGGQARNNIAALDAGTGAATAWDPSASDPVSALAVSGSTVYAGGTFTSIGGQTRYRIAALDATMGAATAWNPNANNQVLALAVNGSRVYAGGHFTSIGGLPLSSVAAMEAVGLVPVLLSRFEVHPESGAIRVEWDTSAESGFAGFYLWRSGERGTVKRLTPDLIMFPAAYEFLDADVIPGVTYHYLLEALDRSGDRQWFGPITALLEPGWNRAALGQSVPNPFTGSAVRIPFVLPQGGEVRVRVLDLSGRQVRLLAQGRLEAGSREVVWDGRDDQRQDVSDGVYLYEVEAPGLRATRRLVRLR